MVHQIARCQPGLNLVFIKQLATWADGKSSLGDDLGGQGDVGRNHEVARLHRIGNGLVGHVQAVSNGPHMKVG